MSSSASRSVGGKTDAQGGRKGEEMARTWRGILGSSSGPRGVRQRRMRTFLLSFYQKHMQDMHDATFTLDEFMENSGLDLANTKDYHAAIRFLMEQRKKTSLVTDAFFSAPEYQHYVNDGLTNDQLFDKMMEAAVTWEVYPVMSAAAVNPGSEDGYRLLTLDDFIALKERRMNSIVNEVQDFVPMYLKLTQRFPELASRYSAPALPEFDGTLRITCDKCGATFRSQNYLVQHYLKRHSRTAQGVETRGNNEKGGDNTEQRTRQIGQQSEIG